MTEMDKAYKCLSRPGREAHMVAAHRWHAEAAGTACTVPFPEKSQQATRDPGWSEVLMSVCVTDNPTWCPNNCKQGTVLRQEMNRGRRRAIHRPEDIIPGYAQPLLKAQRRSRENCTAGSDRHRGWEVDQPLAHG